MDELSLRFGVQWTTQDVLEQPERYQAWLADTGTADSGAARHNFSRALGVNPGSVKWQIEQVPHALNVEYSTRSKNIACEKDKMIADYVRRHGRAPSASTVIKIRQRASLITRKAKQVQSLGDLTAGWRRRALPIVGDSYLASDRIQQQGARSLPDAPLWSFRQDDLTDEAAREAAAGVIAALGTARSTFGKRNAEAEAFRALAHIRFRSPQDRVAAVTRVTSLALAQAIPLTPKNHLATPNRFRTDNGEDMFHPGSRDLFTTRQVWDAEERLLKAGRQTGAPAVDAQLVEQLVLQPTNDEGARVLGADQAAAVRELCASGRLVDVLVGPAGAGKTTALAKLRELWETQHGAGSVKGLAPTARAAEELAASLGIPTENTPKWLYETARGTAADDTMRYELLPGELLIVDEASIAGTIALDQLRTQAEQAGAKLLLVGDWAQLAAVDAGGAFGLVATDRDDVAELRELHRFSQAWEAEASTLLRLGKTAGLAPYLEHGRVTGGLTETMLQQAVDAWKHDESTVGADGKPHTSLLIASTNETVDELNQLARTWRIESGLVDQAHEVAIASGVASPGDRIVTRENARRLRTNYDRWVRNNDNWVVEDIRDNGDIVAVTAGSTPGTDSEQLERVVLPAAYCREHVELAYATTTYRVQGRTVHSAHTIVDHRMMREAFYVAMTRGKQRNHAYVVTGPDADEDGMAPGVQRTWQETLERVVLTKGGDLSAHETRASEADRIGSIRQLAAEYQTLIADQLEQEWLPALEQLGLHGADSPSLGPLLANIRRLSLRNENAPVVLEQLLARRTLGDAHDTIAVLHHRLDAHLNSRYQDAVDPTVDAAELDVHQVRPRIAGILEPAPDTTNPELRAAYEDRERAIQLRAELLVDQAIANGEPWLAALGAPVLGTEHLWRHRAVTVACYRDLYGVDGADALGHEHQHARIRTQHRALAEAALRHEEATAEEVSVKVLQTRDVHPTYVPAAGPTLTQ